MTPQEHAERIQRRLKRVEAAQLSLHNALAAALAEHGATLGIGGDVMASAVPKNEPPNP